MSQRLVSRAVLGGVLSVLASSSLFAQRETAPATVITSTQLKTITDSLPAASLASIPLGRGSGYTYALAHRDITGVVELHVQWTDVFVIQSGSATLLTGGSFVGAKEVSPGELRDGVLKGGTLAKVKPGDVVFIPAGTPHQFVLALGEQVNYLAMKVAVAK